MPTPLVNLPTPGRTMSSLRRTGAVGAVGILIAGLTVSAALPANAAPADCNIFTVPVKVAFQGAYNETTGVMSNAINTRGFLPREEPYSGLEYRMRGGENNTAVLTDTTSANAPVDWLLVELRSAADPTQILATDTVMIGRNGLPVADPEFAVKAGDYYVAIEHRNHLGLMTAAPVAVGASTALVDFSSPSQAVYNNDPSVVDGNRVTVLGVAQMSGGEATHVVGSPTNNVDASDSPNSDKSALFARVGGGTTLPGYFPEDFNMDGLVKISGTPPMNDFIFLSTRQGGRTTPIPEQLPVGVLGAAVGCLSPAVTSPNSASATTGSPFSFTLTADGDPTISFTITGALPAGLTFDPATGIISGTSTVTGTFPITVTATNSVGTDQQTLTLVVSASTAHLPVVSG